MEGNGRKREGIGWNEGGGFFECYEVLKKIVGSGRVRFINDATSP